MKAGIEYIGITTPFYCHDGNGNILIHKRSNNCRDEKGRWDAGSGQLEINLSVEENVLKEVLEEYGCHGQIEGRLPAHDLFREEDGVKTHWLAAPFFIKVNPDEVRIGEPDKINEIKWCAIGDFPEPIHRGFEYTFKKYKKYFEEYFKKN